MKKVDGYSLSVYGPIQKDFEEEVTFKINSSSNVTYKGVLKHGEKITELNKYDALLFPTYFEYEGFPATILESFMAGLPVIASDWKYNSEIVENCKTGLLFKPKSIESIVSCIRALNNNLEKYKDMPINCKKIAEQYSEEKIAPILFKVLDI